MTLDAVDVGPAVTALATRGFFVLPLLFDAITLGELRLAYDRAFSHARADDLRVRESARLASLERYDPIFERCSRAPALLALARAVLGERCVLRFLLARTLPPEAAAQTLHLDVRDAYGPRVHFIIPIDDFDAKNGATRFFAGSHRWAGDPADDAAPGEAEIAAAAAGSVIAFDSAIWHGHTANTTATPRRSIQGGWVSAA